MSIDKGVGGIGEDDRKTLETLWLTYFNDALFIGGAISKNDHEAMNAKIVSRE